MNNLLARTAVFAVVLAAALATASTAVAESTSIDGFAGRKLNNAQQILMHQQTEYGEGYQPMFLWTKGSSTRLTANLNLSVESSLGESGGVIGDAYDFSSFVIGVNQPTPAGVWLVDSAGPRSVAYPGQTHTYLDNGDIISVDSVTRSFYRNGMPAGGHGDGRVTIAPDGSYVLDAQSTSTSAATDMWFPSIGAAGVPLPVDMSGYAIGSNGHMFGSTASTTPVWNRTTVTFTEGPGGEKIYSAAATAYPTLPARNAIRGYVISGKGTVVFAAGPENDLEANTTSVVKIPAGGSPQDITGSVGALTAHRVMDVNEWGDFLLTSFNSGTTKAYNTLLVAGARNAVTGVIQSTTVASGRARAAGLAGKVVKLTGPDLELTATTDRTGRFSFSAPPGTGYELAAPRNACIVAGNGCHTVMPLPPLVEGAKPIALNKVQAPVIASFVQKLGAKLTVTGGNKVKLTVRCGADAACASTVTLRKGTAVWGSGKVSVAKGRTRQVTVTLSRAAVTGLTRSAMIPVGATLVTKAGTERATTSLSVKLVRGR